MFKTKYVKHLSVIVLCVVILFTSSLSAFAESTGTFKFYDFPQKNFAYSTDKDGDGDKELVDCNELVTVEYGVEKSVSAFLNRNRTLIAYDSSLSSYQKTFTLSMPVVFYTNTEYTIKFDFMLNYSSGSTADGNFYLAFSDSSGVIQDLIPIWSGSFTSAYQVNSVDFTFVVPNYTQAFSVSLVLWFGTLGGYSVSRQAFYFSDLSITKPDDIPFEGPPIDNSSSEQIDDLDNQFSEATAALPSISPEQLEEIMNKASTDEFTIGFQVLNHVFDGVVAALDMNVVLIFCLTFGLAIYIIGRRLRA